MGALKRADAVILIDGTGANEPGTPALKSDKPVYRVRFEPTALTETVSGSWRCRPIGALGGKRIVVVSGIARPDRFYPLLGQWDVSIHEIFEFPDHHRYTAQDWLEIARCSQAADLVVTTEKDLVKLEAFPFATGKLVALRIEARVEKGEELIGSVLHKIEQSRAGTAESVTVAGE